MIEVSVQFRHFLRKTVISYLISSKIACMNFQPDKILFGLSDTTGGIRFHCSTWHLDISVCVYGILACSPFLNCLPRAQPKIYQLLRKKWLKKIRFMTCCYMDWYRLNTPFLLSFYTG